MKLEELATAKRQERENKEELVQFPWKGPASLKDRLDRTAEKYGLSRAAIINAALDEYLPE